MEAWNQSEFCGIFDLDFAMDSAISAESTLRFILKL